ncbi:hypothetical protein B9Z55_028531 [Caenorhabditis nigoni]|uniref:Uncharacterized protein n=1 Tax=Caenorhabditis nigoni TaxID=1611254 RepID=A0A2G5SB84_9PELO|nr:hypothetical protein B9Z55_028531 [Caenorhabditis nigoni]
MKIKQVKQKRIVVTMEFQMCLATIAEKAELPVSRNEKSSKTCLLPYYVINPRQFYLSSFYNMFFCKNKITNS